MFVLVLVSAIAGIVGTGIGGIVGVFFGRKNEKTLSGVLGFASGVMLSIVCFDLLPQAIFMSNSLCFVIASLLGGVIMVLLLGCFVDKYTEYRKKDIKTHDNLLDLNYLEVPPTSGNTSLYRAGIIMFLAISLHNFPEGMAIGAGGYTNQANGIMLGMLIALHNVPEGMSISSPLVAGGMNKVKAVLLTAISGAFTLLGGIVGYLISSFSVLFTALSIAFAGGAMLYVTFGEIIPEALNLNKGHASSIFVIVGIIVGLLISTLLA